MDKTMRTAAGAMLQTALKWNLPYEVMANSTLNQKFGILPNMLPTSSRDLAVRYMTIGIGGQNISVGAGGRRVLTSAFRQPSHASLYDHVPFVMREFDNDLPVVQRNNYRLRTVMTVGGKQYIAYYARVLPAVTTPVSLELRTQEDGDVITTTPWSYPIDSLNPKPPLLTNNQTMVTGSDSLVSTCILDLTISKQETKEIVDAVTILFGSEAYAVISEIGLCSGVDYDQAAGDSSGGTINYREAIAVQVSDILSVNFPAVYNNTGISYSIDVGAVEPLLMLSSV